MNIKLIASDLDGTLSQRPNEIGQPEIDALKEASKQGIYVVIATGRTWGMLTQISEQLYKNDFVVISNGAAIYDIEKGSCDVVSEIPYAKWESIYHQLAESGASFEIYHSGRSLIDRKYVPKFDNFKIPADILEKIKASMDIRDNLLEHLRGESVEKVNIMNIPKDKYKELYETFEKDAELAVTSSFPGNMEVNAAGCGKGKALQHLIDRLGIKNEEVMVFGDADNDIDMLEWAENSFAMANATEAAKKAAKHMTLANTENGVAHAIRKYALK